MKIINIFLQFSAIFVTWCITQMFRRFPIPMKVFLSHIWPWKLTTSNTHDQLTNEPITIFTKTTSKCKDREWCTKKLPAFCRTRRHHLAELADLLCFFFAFILFFKHIYISNCCDCTMLLVTLHRVHLCYCWGGSAEEYRDSGYEHWGSTRRVGRAWRRVVLILSSMKSTPTRRGQLSISWRLWAVNKQISNDGVRNLVRIASMRIVWKYLIQ